MTVALRIVADLDTLDITAYISIISFRIKKTLVSLPGGAGNPNLSGHAGYAPFGKTFEHCCLARPGGPEHHRKTARLKVSIHVIHQHLALARLVGEILPVQMYVTDAIRWLSLLRRIVHTLSVHVSCSEKVRMSCSKS